MLEQNQELILSDEDIWLASRIGCKRQIAALQQGRTPHGANDRRGWQMNVEGCLGELAICRALNIEWHAAFTRSGRNLPDTPWFDVRTSFYQDLRIYPKDTRKQVSVQGSNGTYVVMGWLDPQDLKGTNKGKRFWSEQWKKWNVPPEHINTMDAMKYEEPATMQP